MAKLQIKLEVFFFALLLITATSIQGIRVLPVEDGNKAAGHGYMKGKTGMKEEAASAPDDSVMADFTSMDYSAASNKAPIHN